VLIEDLLLVPQSSGDLTAAVVEMIENHAVARKLPVRRHPVIAVWEGMSLGELGTQFDHPGVVAGMIVVLSAERAVKVTAGSPLSEAGAAHLVLAFGGAAEVAQDGTANAAR